LEKVKGKSEILFSFLIGSDPSTQICLPITVNLHTVEAHLVVTLFLPHRPVLPQSPATQASHMHRVIPGCRAAPRHLPTGMLNPRTHPPCPAPFLARFDHSSSSPHGSSDHHQWAAAAADTGHWKQTSLSMIQSRQTRPDNLILAASPKQTGLNYRRCDSTDTPLHHDWPGQASLFGQEAPDKSPPQSMSRLKPPACHAHTPLAPAAASIVPCVNAIPIGQAHPL
jgi:hypothetical protein